MTDNRQTPKLTDLSQDYQRGALAFKALLIELEAQHGQALKAHPGASVHFPNYAPGIRARFEEAANNPEMSAGLWDALAVLLGFYVDGTVLIPDRWNVLEDVVEGGGHE